MSNLKTLKDLEHEKILNGDPDTRIYSWRLKEEAIKWINHYITLEHMEYESGVDCTREIQWIMHFFNIEEDELNL
jgi:hypothetical protein